MDRRSQDTDGGESLIQGELMLDTGETQLVGGVMPKSTETVCESKKRGDLQF